MGDAANALAIDRPAGFVTGQTKGRGSVVAIEQRAQYTCRNRYTDRGNQLPAGLSFCMSGHPLAAWHLRINSIYKNSEPGQGPPTFRGTVDMLIQAIFLRTALLLALWWVLSEGAPASWLIGLLTVALAVLVSLRIMPPQGDRIAFSALPGFLAFFVWRSIKGGFQVALISLKPRLELLPAMVVIRLRLPEEPGRVFLASMMNLLPGTLSVGLKGDCLRLHVLDRRLPIEAEVRDAEQRIARLLKIAL